MITLTDFLFWSYLTELILDLTKVITLNMITLIGFYCSYLLAVVKMFSFLLFFLICMQDHPRLSKWTFVRRRRQPFHFARKEMYQIYFCPLFFQPYLSLSHVYTHTHTHTQTHIHRDSETQAHLDSRTEFYNQVFLPTSGNGKLREGRRDKSTISHCKNNFFKIQKKSNCNVAFLNTLSDVYLISVCFAQYDPVKFIKIDNIY
jgi:hypothetical protein